MNKLLYLTGSESKFLTAQHQLSQHGIELEQQALDIPEIQAATTEEVAIDKAKKAYALVGQPLLVSDHGWLVSALGGFPGPYMKYINNWLNPDDFLRLMTDATDREVTLRQDLIFTDGQTVKAFTYDITGEILTEARGKMGTNWDKVVSLTGDGKSIAESRDAIGSKLILKNTNEPWISFASWYLNEYSK